MAKYQVRYEPLKDTVFKSLWGNDDPYSLSGVEIHLHRQLQPFVLNVFFPSGVLVVISFVSFLIPVDQLPGRMSLIVTTFLMLITISSSERLNGPKVREKLIRVSGRF